MRRRESEREGSGGVAKQGVLQHLLAGGYTQGKGREETSVLKVKLADPRDLLSERVLPVELPQKNKTVTRQSFVRIQCSIALHCLATNYNTSSASQVSKETKRYLATKFRTENKRTN